MTDQRVPLLVCAKPFGTLAHLDFELELIMTDDIAHDLRELSRDECVQRGIRHTSTDAHYTALSDADTDAHCRQALVSAARRNLAID
jgi:hypothetical protein